MVCLAIGQHLRHGNAFRLHRRWRSAFCGMLAARLGSPIVRAICDDLLQVTDRSFGAIGMAPLCRAIERGGVHLVDTKAIYPVGAVKGDRQWSKAFEYAIRSPKPESVCAVHLWLGGRSYADADAVWQANRDATACLTADVMASSLLPALETACLRVGLPLKSYCTKDRWRQHRRETTNLATWGVKWTSERCRRGGKNVLYLENGLLCQSAGRYVDHLGFFCDSSICTEPQPDPTAAEIAALQAHVRRHFGWDWWGGGDPAGPILVACQKHNDMSVRFHYAPQRRGRATVLSLIEDCQAHLPAGIPVLLRPHPTQRDALDMLTLPSGWTVDRSPSIYPTLRQCRALVTITSTVATEALALGLPVACLGRSAWEGHQVVLECATDPARLSGILDWHPEEWPVLRYLCAVLRHQLPYDVTADQVLANASVQTWLSRAGRPVVVADPAVALADAEARVRASGDAFRVWHLEALLRRRADCPTCARLRIDRQILDLAATLQAPCTPPEKILQPVQ